MAPVLLALDAVDADVDGWEAVVAPEGPSELLVESVVGCFVLGVGVVDCDSESVVVEPVVEAWLGLVFVVEVGGAEVSVEGGTNIGVGLDEGVDTTVTVTDDAAWVCEIVFAAWAESDDHAIPAGLSKPEPIGSAANSAWQERGNAVSFGS
jgi:hypothetical protein